MSSVVEGLEGEVFAAAAGAGLVSLVAAPGDPRPDGLSAELLLVPAPVRQELALGRLGREAWVLAARERVVDGLPLSVGPPGFVVGAVDGRRVLAARERVVDGLSLSVGTPGFIVGAVNGWRAVAVTVVARWGAVPVSVIPCRGSVTITVIAPIWEEIRLDGGIYIRRSDRPIRAQVRAFQIRASQVGPFELRAAEVGTLQVGTAQVGGLEVRAPQVRGLYAGSVPVAVVASVREEVGLDGRLDRLVEAAGPGSGSRPRATYWRLNAPAAPEVLANTKTTDRKG